MKTANSRAFASDQKATTGQDYPKERSFAEAPAQSWPGKGGGGCQFEKSGM